MNVTFESQQLFGKIAEAAFPGQVLGICTFVLM